MWKLTKNGYMITDSFRTQQEALKFLIDFEKTLINSITTVKGVIEAGYKITR